MRSRNTLVLVLILLLAVLVLFIVLPIDHPSFAKQALFWQPAESRDLTIKQGLDLQGGTQVLLEAKPPVGQTVTADDLAAAKAIVERRVNGLGVTEPLVQLQGENRIIVELPGISNPEQAVQTLRSTGQLEFVEIPDDALLTLGANAQELLQGTYIRTTNNPAEPDPARLGETQSLLGDQVFTTVMTGRELADAGVTTDPTTTAPQISFSLKPDGSQVFGQYTGSHIGGTLAIVLDNVVLSAPTIQSAITGGQGVITGRYSLEEARNLAVQLRYGALPVPLEVVNRNTIGATLGADSVQKSILAGAIGLVTVLIFMTIYYRLPGFLAALALILYAGINLALYKLIPVTLTLPGIAGFLLSTGMAVDANILIFERMKEELRWGRTVRQSVEAGFDRAWTSILDSNLSTLIICLILILFGRTFGAQAVLGFALNLGIGVLVSMFTAVVVTRTLMRAVFDKTSAEAYRERHWLLGA
ncbi:MAG: protein translocase subunit SecD [Anaerolineae bacterium]|jgi:preprotein translocase subunit SecD|nr:protein translocase subunit SecD [Anaerolineae bacterium]